VNTSGVGASASSITCSQLSVASIKCAGTQDLASAVIDWKFSPKWDTYIGGSYVHASGGLDSGYLNSSTWTTTAGVRFRW
jgi:hypothetical protein